MSTGVDSQQIEMKPPTAKSFDAMNAIARGVEARLELIAGFSKMVTYQTINVARRLRIDEGEVQNWAATRAMMESSRSSLIRVSTSHLDSDIMAKTFLVLLFEQSKERIALERR